MTPFASIQPVQNCATGSISIQSAGGRSNVPPTSYACRHLLTVVLLYLATAVGSPAQTFTTLFRFNGTTNGAYPNGPLVQGLDGYLYGTTFSGGTQTRGTVFKVSPAGVLTTIYNFCSLPNCADGGLPRTGLLLATDGNFYGSTTEGGNTFYGTLFKITSQGHLTVLRNLCSATNCHDGSNVISPLIQGGDGSIYGASGNGGVENRVCYGGCGLVFKLTLRGVFSVLYRFCSQPNCADGGGPNGLIQGTDSNFYGTTEVSPNLYGGGGTVFRLTPTGILTKLYSFCAKLYCTDGDSPRTGLTQASDGDLYGTTQAGGSTGIQAGTVFKVTPPRAITTIHGFCALPDCADGGSPSGALVQGTDGNFYGTDTYGGTRHGGTLFKLSPTGTLTVLYNFPNWRRDFQGVVQATDGNFYGTTQDNASNYYGTIFREITGLGPFVKILPTSGALGAKVTILGTHLTGAIDVRFNGAPAVFTIISQSEITATVPAGATTGTVKVTTPTETLSSNIFFGVR